MSRGWSFWSFWPFLGALLLAVTLSACSSNEVDKNVGGAVSSAIDKAKEEGQKLSSSAVGAAIGKEVRDRLKAEGIELADTPSCNPNVDFAGITKGVSGTVACTGRTVKDNQPVDAVFSGQFGPNNCSGTLVVKVAGQEKVNKQDLSLC